MPLLGSSTLEGTLFSKPFKSEETPLPILDLLALVMPFFLLSKQVVLADADSFVCCLEVFSSSSESFSKVQVFKTSKGKLLSSLTFVTFSQARLVSTTVNFMTSVLRFGVFTLR
ncbi:hypothetical protein V8G54_014808 [Vigna mungo]|uniref:Uncharacterized protein n=1 Tax=Vigna mungo TaxID=3915 RepID=A0AAQ3RYX0_VIGMU